VPVRRLWYQAVAAIVGSAVMYAESTPGLKLGLSTERSKLRIVDSRITPFRSMLKLLASSLARTAERVVS
jgi:hypothetical protein